MKRKLVTAFGVATLGMASYAATFMNVKTVDGNIVKYDVANVEEVNFVTEETSSSSDNNYVDLGLPSGTLWATYNVGATKPEDFGDYFAWGETQTKDVFDYHTYKYCTSIEPNWTLESLTKYNFGFDGIKDSLATLLPDDDVATVLWGAEWRMPTAEEFKELIDNCEYSWVEVNGVNGGKYTGPNGKSVFLPASGYHQNSELFEPNVSGNYWTSSLEEDGGLWSLTTSPFDFAALFVYLDKEKTFGYPSHRINGFSIRPVRAK